MQLKYIGLIVSAISILVSLFTYLDQKSKHEPVTFWGSWRVIACFAGIIVAVAAWFYLPGDPLPKPRLAIAEAPSFSNITKDSFTVRWTIGNFGNAVADSLHDLELEIDIKDSNAQIFTGSIHSIIPDESSLLPGGTISMSQDFSNRFVSTDSSVVYFMKIAYQDSLGHKIDTFRKFIGIPSPIKDAVISEISPQAVSSLRRQLKRLGYW
jgi:hypothetical protein